MQPDTFTAIEPAATNAAEEETLNPAPVTETAINVTLESDATIAGPVQFTILNPDRNKVEFEAEMRFDDEEQSMMTSGAYTPSTAQIDKETPVTSIFAVASYDPGNKLRLTDVDDSDTASL